jgi:hypothetical protein
MLARSLLAEPGEAVQIVEGTHITTIDGKAALPGNGRPCRWRRTCRQRKTPCVPCVRSLQPTVYFVILPSAFHVKLSSSGGP